MTIDDEMVQNIFGSMKPCCQHCPYFEMKTEDHETQIEGNKISLHVVFYCSHQPVCWYFREMGTEDKDK
jgi:hypothetical protein